MDWARQHQALTEARAAAVALRATGVSGTGGDDLPPPLLAPNQHHQHHHNSAAVPKLGHVEVSVVGSPELFGSSGTGVDSAGVPPVVVAPAIEQLQRRLSTASSTATPTILPSSSPVIKKTSSAINPSGVGLVYSDDERVIERCEVSAGGDTTKQTTATTSVSTSSSPDPTIIPARPLATRSTAMLLPSANNNNGLTGVYATAAALNSSLCLPTSMSEALQMAVNQERLKSISPGGRIPTGGVLRLGSGQSMLPSVDHNSISPSEKRRGSFTTGAVPPKKRFMISSVGSDSPPHSDIGVKQEDMSDWPTTVNVKSKTASDSAIAKSKRKLNVLVVNFSYSNN